MLQNCSRDRDTNLNSRSKKEHGLFYGKERRCGGKPAAFVLLSKEAARKLVMAAVTMLVVFTEGNVMLRLYLTPRSRREAGT